MPGARLREKLGSKLTIRGRRGRTTDKAEALPKPTASQDPSVSQHGIEHPDYASVESSPWGTFESHVEIHSNGSTNVSSQEPLKGWTISTTTTTATTGPETSPPITTKMAEGKKAAVSVSSCTASNRKLGGTKSFILRKSQPFKRLCHSAFHAIDCDNSGQVDKQELYTGLLLIHLRLAAYVGPAACRPVTKDQADALFDLMDVDHSATLSEKEFEEVMIVLCSSIVSRVFLLFVMTIFFIPILARNTVSLLLQLYAHEPLKAYVTTSWNQFVNNPIFLQITSPNQNALFHVVHSTYTACCNATSFLVTKIPRTVLDAMPFSLVSSVLGSLLVPWCLLKIDAFFETMAKGSVDKKDKDE